MTNGTWREEDHPRADNGQFGEGANSESESIKVDPTDEVSASRIEPIHGVRDNEKLNLLVESMEEKGWTGRPIPVYEGIYGKMALTGSHRIAAAKKAGIDIPIYEIDGLADFSDSEGRTIDEVVGTGFNQDLVNFLREFGDEDAIHLAEMEDEWGTIVTQDEAELINDLDLAMAQDGEHWITTESGSHLLIDGNEGDGYTIKGGAGGKLNGQKIQPKSMSANRINEKSSAFNSPDFKPHEESKNNHAESILPKRPQRPDFWNEIKSEAKKKGDDYWNGQYYSSKKKDHHRIYVGGKEHHISNEQKGTLDKYFSDLKKFGEESKPYRQYLNVPYEKKDHAKSKGAIWDKDKGKWYVPHDVPVHQELEQYRQPQAKQKKPTEQQKSQSQTKPQTNIKDMSKEELTSHMGFLNRQRENYNNAVNEGGEGYNPFDAKIEEASKRLNELSGYSRAEGTPSTHKIHLSTRGWGDYPSVEWSGDLSKPTHEIVSEMSDALSKSHDLDTPLNHEQLTELVKAEKNKRGYAQDMALDKTLRSHDPDGRMRVEKSHISKACVNPYVGSEIPNYEGLGLQADKVYHLLRDPQELEKAAPTFVNLPLLSEHVPVTADEPRQDLIVGSTGSDVEFDGEYLDVSLSVWDAKAIAGIETKEKTELSSAYRYTADMTPGEFNGVKYDGVMRDIIGNHVALVDVGRAGRDVVVSDRNPFLTNQGNDMKRKGSAVAQAKVDTVIAQLKPKLAQDADIEDLTNLLDALAGDPAADEADNDEPTAIDSAGAGQVVEFLKGKLSDEDLASVAEMLSGSAPQTAGDEEFEDNGDKDKPPVPPKDAEKPAMDAAMVEKIASQRVSAAIAARDALHDARSEVESLVGKVALDSAEAVYKFALDHAGVDTKGVHPSAYKAMVVMVKGQKSAPSVGMGMDGASVNKAEAQFPDLKRFQ